MFDLFCSFACLAMCLHVCLVLVAYFLCVWLVGGLFTSFSFVCLLYGKSEAGGVIPDDEIPSILKCGINLQIRCSLIGWN